MDQCISTRPLGPYKQTPWGPAPLTGETACSSALPSTGLIQIWNPGPWSKRPQNLSLLTSDPALVPGYSVTTTTTTKSLQSCPTLCDPIDGSPPSSPVPGILQARTLERVAISFSNAGKWKVKVKLLKRVRPSATPWTAAFQAPPSMGFSRQEYWSGVPLSSLGYSVTYQ